MFFTLSLFWFIRTTKATLFWLYLWQLKEYHIGRFLDHFRTEKGKKLFINKLLILKIFLIIFFLISSFSLAIRPFPQEMKEVVHPGYYKDVLIYLSPWEYFNINLWVFSFYLLFILYFLELIRVLQDFFQKRLKKPVLTKKTAFLISTSLLVELLIIFILFRLANISLFILGILFFDVLIPLITSAIILFFQPIAVFARNQIIRKAQKKRAQFKNLLVIGITGSYGKTSTKEFLATILSEKFGENKVLKTKEHQNSEVGISHCIINDLKEDHEIFIAEMGAYNRGGIKLLCDIAKPKIGILTGINEQHMATFGSQENIIRAKYELVESLPEDGLAIFNGDNRYCQELYQKTTKPKRQYNTFSTAVENVLYSDVWAENVRIEKERLSFRVFSRDRDSADFRVNIFGIHNVLNILAAACCAKELGMSLGEISLACEKIKPEQGAIKLIKNKNGLNLIDSTYSANPDGVITDLDYLKIWEGKKVIVMPCLIELGKASKEVHERIGQKIAEVCNLAIIITKESFKEIKEGAIESGMKNENILFIENTKEIFEKIKSFYTQGDVILLESRVPSELIKQLV